MGLTTLRTWTFYWVSQVGMLAGTAVYVNAGTQLAQLHTLADVVSPTLFASLALLGLFPLVAKRLIQSLNAQRVYEPWKALKPKTFDRNLIVIGAGAGGLVSAYIAAAVKAEVTLVESHKMGGDCLNYGCVPSKALIKSATLAHQIRHASSYGLCDAEPQFDFKALMGRIQNIIGQIAPHDSVERYTGLGVDVQQGHATIVNPWTVEIALHDGTTNQLTTRSIVIAAGASPIVPALPGLSETGYLTSDTMWETLAARDALPARLLVLGGGPIGCEMAQSFARLGSQVTLVEASARVLVREDPEVSELVAASLRADGVTLLTGHTALRCEVRDGIKRMWVKHAADVQPVEILFDDLLCAVGRRARLSGYGLETLGIPIDTTVQTNDYLQTIYPNIYAAGDVAGPYQFTHTAAHQAWYAAVNALFGDFKKFKADYSVIPAATFTDPEIARVGLNEQEAAAQGIAVEVTRFELQELDRAIADSATQGFVKVLTTPGKDRIVGVTIAAAHAGDLLAEYVLAMKHSLGLNKILGTIHTYPTMAEANKYAAGTWKRAHQPATLLRWVKRYHAWRRGP
jgi:pyruvate/2-oxoglutarate dehydrogenase complex dihydrolipoamide dehydrogenase (E3) component